MRLGAAPAPEAEVHGGGSPALAEISIPGHGFAWGKHLCIARIMAMLKECSHGWFGRQPRRDAKGGGRSAASERRRGVRLEKDEREAG
jgi:hypothetical protein